MPSNNILINRVIPYEVHDDNMPQLIDWLEENGCRVDEQKVEPATCSRVKS